MDTNLLFIIVIGILVGAVSGYLGSFMVLKRMSLVGDALSHVALPGMAIALTFGINPMIGAITTLAVAVFGIWYMAEKSDIYPEALVGVFFTASLAIGILITPEPELLETLFGSIENITLTDGLITILASCIIYAVTKKIANNLILGVVSEDLSSSTGINVSRLNLVYLLMVGLVVALGVKFVGTLLTGALVIIPAAASKNLAKNIRGYFVGASIIGVFSAILGIVLSNLFSISPGPSVVLVSVVIFVISYVFKNS